MLYMVAGQALFRGTALYWPQDLWNVAAQKWEKYRGRVPKEENWADIVSEAEAEDWKKP